MLGVMEYEHSYFYRVNCEKARLAASPDEKLRNNVDAKPTFFFGVTNDLNLRLLVSGLMGK